MELGTTAQRNRSRSSSGDSHNRDPAPTRSARPRRVARRVPRSVRTRAGGQGDEPDPSRWPRRDLPLLSGLARTSLRSRTTPPRRSATPIRVRQHQNNSNHVHRVWRDPTNDLGVDVLIQHRAAQHAPRRSTPYVDDVPDAPMTISCSTWAPSGAGVAQEPPTRLCGYEWPSRSGPGLGQWRVPMCVLIVRIHRR